MPSLLLRLLLPLAFSPLASWSALPACLDGFALFGHEQVSLGSSDSIASGKTGSNSHLALGSGVKSQSLRAKGNISIGSSAKVTGDAIAGGTITLGTGAQITGAKTQGASVAVCAIPQETVTAGTQDITLGTNAVRNLAPGSYRNITLGTSARLHLVPGVYKFQSLTTGGSSRLELNTAAGAVEILVMGNISLGTNSRVAFTGTAAPEKVRLYSAGTTVSLGSGAEFLGTIQAPLASVALGNKVLLRGAAFAKILSVGSDVKVFNAPFSTGPSVVKITSPANGFLTLQGSIAVAWTVDGVAQTAQLTETLALEGNNKVKRCAGSVCDSINVIRDQTAPVVAITAPANGTLTNQTSVAVAWTVDGVAQSTQTTETLANEGANTITRSATDAAGNTGTASVQVIRDTQAPVVAITSPVNGSTTSQASIPVAWTVDGVAQTTQLSENLTEGANTITRSATDAAGNTGSHSLTVTFTPPVSGSGGLKASAFVTPSNGPAPLSVVFTGKGSNDSGRVKFHQYDFDGNGVFDTILPAIPDTVSLHAFDFESGAAGWEFGGTGGNMGVGHGGARVGGPAPNRQWTTNAAPEYPENMNAWILSPPISVPSLALVQVIFTHHFMAADDREDSGFLEAVDSLGNVTRLRLFDGEWGSETTTIDASIFSGKTMRLRFRFVSDDAETSSGWQIDNISMRYQKFGQPMVTVFTDNVEGLVAWEKNPTGPQWSIVETEGVGSPVLAQGLGWLEPDTSAYAYADGADVFAVSPKLGLPVQGRLHLAYSQFLFTADAGDGGVVEISRNGGAFQLLTPAGGYPGTITGHGNGFTGLLGRTRPVFDLAPFAGDSVQLRFRFFSDAAGSARGWLIDSVRIFEAFGFENGISEVAHVYPNPGAYPAVFAVTDSAGNIKRADARLTAVTVGPAGAATVAIVSPTRGQLVNTRIIPVVWTVGGVQQTAATAETLHVEGENIITRSFTDGGGYTATATTTVIRDTIPPVVVIHSPVNGQLTNQTVLAVVWSVDGVTQTTGNVANITVEGANTITRSATDAAGNTASASVQVIRDRIPPTVVITSPASGTVTTQSSIVVRWTVDGVNQTADTLQNLNQGLNFVQRFARDAAGNTGIATVLVTRDNIAPVVDILSPADGDTVLTSPLMVEYTVDEELQEPALFNLQPGENEIVVQSADEAGNVGFDTVNVFYVETACLLIAHETVHFNEPHTHGCLIVGKEGVLHAHARLTVDTLIVETGGRLVSDDTVESAMIIRAENGGVITHTALAAGEENHRVHFIGNVVTLKRGSRVDVSLKGFPEGHGPGGQVNNTEFGTGGSHAGLGGFAQFLAYGDPLMPVMAGSGGGNSEFHFLEGMGGGAVRIQADKLTLDGEIRADGGASFNGAGAGGSVWLTANQLQGEGLISATGGVFRFENDGSGGRVAVYADSIPAAIRGNIFAQGHAGGTIYLNDGRGFNELKVDTGFGGPTSVPAALNDTTLLVSLNEGARAQFNGHARVQNIEWHGQALASFPGQLQMPKLIMERGILEIGDTSRIDTVFLDLQSMLSHRPGVPASTGKVHLISHVIEVGPEASIDVSGRGFPEGYGPDGRVSSSSFAGGSHGGLGSSASIGVYGSFTQPTLAGSGGGSPTGGFGDGRGGGVIRLQAETLILEGALRADGSPAFLSSGAGGSIWLTADEILGAGVVSANGGVHALSGGGGRVAIDGCNIPQEIRDQITVDGANPGSIYMPCFIHPVVKIFRPTEGEISYTADIPVVWQADEIPMTADTVAHLEDGFNTLIRCYTNLHGLTGCDTVTVRLDLTPPVVEIISPLDGSYTNSAFANVFWTVDGMPQGVQTSHFLVEGPNLIIRSFTDAEGSTGADTVRVTLDTKPPVIALLWPDQSASIAAPFADLRWSVDGVEQPPIHVLIDSSAAVKTTLQYTDSANNSSSLEVFLYAGTRVPNLIGATAAAAESLLTQSRLGMDSAWVDNDTVATGLVFAQTPAAGDSSRYHFPVSYKISRGLDALDLVPQALITSEMTVNPNTLAAGGSVRVMASNRGRAALNDSLDIRIFEDRNLDRLYTPDVDLLLADTVHLTSLPAGDSTEFVLAVAGSLTFNGNRISVVLDHLNRIAETHDDNNATHSMAQCKKLPLAMDYTPEILWQWTDPSGASGTGSVFTKPLVANFTDDNGDGKINAEDVPDVAVMTQDNSLCSGYLRVLDGSNGQEIWTRERNPFGFSNMATGDIDGDGKPELVYLETTRFCWDRRVVVLDHEGAVKDTGDWHFFGSIAFAYDGIRLHDMDGDGKSEILWGENIHDYRARLIHPRQFFKEIENMTVADLDGDGYKELMGARSTSTDFSVRNTILSFKDKNVRRRANEFLNYPSYALAVKSGSLPGPDILFQSQSGDFLGGALILDTLLQTKSHFQGVHPVNPYFPFTSTTVETPYFYGTGSARLSFSLGTVSGGDGRRGFFQPYFARSNLRDSTVTYSIFEKDRIGDGTVFDFNDDGDPEVFLMTEDSMYIFAPNGDVLFRKQVPPHSGANMVSVADVNKDGHADLVVGFGNPGHSITTGWGPLQPGVIVYSNPTWTGARGIINQDNYTVTNVNDDGSIPRFPTPNWQANNTVNIQCTEGHYACVDISASFPQITVNDSDHWSVTARIGNGGAIGVPAGLPVSVYVSHLGGPESLLATLPSPKFLNPGEFYTLQSRLPADMRGSFTFRIVADDSGNGQGKLDESSEDNNTVTATFLVDNKPPMVTQPDNQYAEPDELFTYAIAATDPDLDTLHYALEKSCAGMTLGPNTGLLEWTPAQNPPRCTVTVAVTDDYQGGSSVTFLVYVGNRNNQPPVITSTPELVATLHTISSNRLNPYAYAITATDPEGEFVEFELGCASCVGKPGPQLNGNQISWIVFQPPWTLADSATLQVRAIDARGGIALQNFTVRFNRNSNQPPVFASSPNLNAVEDQPYKSPVHVFDLDDDPVTLFLDTIPLGMTFSNDSLRWTPTNPAESRIVRLAATDGIATTYQRFEINVAPRNDAPRITSLPPTQSIAGSRYSYALATFDEDGDALTYTLADKPTGMTVSPQGLIEWTSPQTPGATAHVEVVAKDPSLAEARQTWTIQLLADTLAPTVSLTFTQNPVRPGTAVTVDVHAADNVDVSTVALSLNGSPVSLTGGQYTFTPAVAGTYAFEAQASDPAGNTGIGSGLLRASLTAGNTAPVVSLSHTPQNPQAGDLVTFTVNASDDDGIDHSRVWVMVDGLNLMAVNGQAQYTALRPGAVVAQAVAFDSLGASALASDAYTVAPLAGDHTAPLAEITSPAEDSTLYGQADLIGTAFDANLAYYTLSHRDLNTSAFIEYFRSTQTVQAANLGRVDATTLVNGDYEIRLDVYDRAGNSTSHSVQVHIAGEKKIGNFTLAFTDLSIPMAGIDLSVIRSYDSRIKAKGDFGIGWEMGMRSIRLHENRNQGTEWRIDRTPGFTPQYSIAGTKAHTVTMTLPGGRKQEFDAVPRFFSPFNPTFGVMEYKAKPGTYGRLEAVSVDTFLVMGGEFFDQHGDFQETFNPQQYKLTLVDGSYFVFDQDAGGVVESVDANGNKVEWDGNALKHNAGQTLHFNRDGAGRITSISDEAGRGMQYSYDVLGNLAQVLDANGNPTLFKYGPNSYLNEIIDARGVRATRTEYDDENRMVRQINADGDTLKMTHNLAQNTEEVEDFNGNNTSFTYDERGNVLSKTDDAGNTWTYTYDSLDNLLSTGLPGGASKSSTYDAKGNELTSTDEMGKTTTRTYNDLGKPLTSEDALGRLTRYEYDGNGNLRQEIGPDGEEQFLRSYNGKGNVLTEKDAMGNLTTNNYRSEGWLRFTVDGLGRMTSFGHFRTGNVAFEVDAQGDTTHYDYDANGNKTIIVNALGDTVRTEYNVVNQVTKQIDALGNATHFFYNALGDKVADSTADGAVTRREYDSQGNVVKITDPMGRVTRMEYDHENRVTKTIFSDNSFTTNTYDALGRRTRTVDANGNPTEYEYDAAGRNKLVRDALGHETKYEYDDVGRKTAMVDALNQRTEYVYDDYDRMTKTTFADGTWKSTGYDLAGRKIRETDPMGKVTGFEYDSVGNLRAVIDALNHRAEYTYDGKNNRLTQKDANNHTTTMTYDALNRMVSRTYPNGDQERWSYDAAGNKLSEAKGSDSTAYEYDVMNREAKRKHFPSGHEVRITYTVDGQRDSVIDHRGLTRFDYDNRGRLFIEEMPNGDYIQNHYDAQGNRIRLTTPFGVTKYGYDSLNRMDSVTSPQNQVTRYFYNAVGNRDSAAIANGTSVGYSYDSLNRLTELRNWGGGGSLLSRYTYTLNASGIRTAVDELDGSRVVYTYDDLYRLRNETRTGTHPYTNSFTYDPVGNRLTQVKNGVTTGYTYNDRDQLLAETNPSEGITYEYDGEGRIESKTDAVGTTTYAWVDNDRLASVTGPGVHSQYTYDADGRKIKEQSGSFTKQYLIDRLLPYGQVILETDGSNQLVVEYVFGIERISQERNGQVSWYLSDGQGSIRQLTEMQSAITDAYSYTAFGELLASTGTTINEFRYVSEQADPSSGFYYLRARWMNPKTGSFASIDPYGGDPQSPLSLHRYLYANCSPINGQDPTGRVTLVDITVALNIAGYLATGYQIGSGIGQISEGNVSSGLMDIGLGLMGTGVISVSSKAVLAGGARLFKYRREYVQLVEGMSETINSMRISGKTGIEIMNWAVEERNIIKIFMRNKMVENSVTATEKIIAKAANAFADIRVGSPGTELEFAL